MEAIGPTKICTKCSEGQQSKPVSAFFKDMSRPDGLTPYCKECIKKGRSTPEQRANRKAYLATYHLLHAEKINARSVQWGKDHPERMAAKNKRSKKKRILEQVAAGEREMPRKRRNLAQGLENGEKECSQCEVVKALGDFYASTGSLDGVQAECKDCHDGRSQPIYPRDESIVEKACSQCREMKTARAFYDDPYRRSGIKAACKACTDTKNTEWADANPDKHKAIANRYGHRARQDPIQGPIIRARLHRRRAQIKQAPVIDPVIDIAVLYVRDQGQCSLCSKRVDLKLKWPDPMSATMDHIIPLTKGGEHSWKNVALAHFICNTKKNNRIQTQQMRLF